MKRKWTFSQRSLKQLNDLMTIISPSMNEVAMAKHLRTLWKNMGAEVKTDIMGNVHASLGCKNALSIGIVAHMDTIAVQVTKILPNGLLQMRHIGPRPHTLLGQPMKVLTRKGIIEGVIGFDPTSQYGQPKGLVDDDLWMDIGASSYENACDMVEVGDTAVFAPRFTEISNQHISGTALDDRIGLFVMNESLKQCIALQIPVNLHFIASVQEEVGLRGSAIIAANTPLDACIVIDVDYATDTPTPHDNQMGSLCMGKGVGLHVKSDNNPVMRRIALEVATVEKIPVQQSLGRFIYGGTDSTSLQLQQRGVATLNLNIPCRYMHSPVEMCHKRDVESAIQLLVALNEELGRRQQKSFIPGID